MQKQTIYKLTIIIALLFTITGFIHLYQIKEQAKQTASIAQNQLTIETTTEITTEETTETTTIADFDTLLTNLENSDQIANEIQQLVQTEYQNSYLDAQADILAALNTNDINIEESGHLFLPTHPAQYVDAEVKQIDIPLLLQKDQSWRQLSYGTDTTKQLGENGCAIVSLAMIDSYYSEELVEPKDILRWSRNDYYLHDQGTSWSIFYDFAVEHGYSFEDFGLDFYRAMEAVAQGHIVIVSVQPGYFTEVGHLFLVRGYDPAKQLVYVNDPNDNSEKMFSLQGIDENILLADALNFWTIYK